MGLPASLPVPHAVQAHEGACAIVFEKGVLVEKVRPTAAQQVCHGGVLQHLRTVDG